MKQLKNVVILTVFCILILGVFSKANAASANISSNKTSMTVGDTATITVSYTAAAWNIQVTGAVSYSDAAVSSNAKNASNSKTLKFKPSKAGTYNVTLKGDVSDGDTGTTTDLNKTIKITVKEKTSNNTTDGTTTTNNNNTPATSKDATLRNLGITPNDFKGFKSNTTTYNVTVPKSTDNIKIYADATDKKATVSGTGSKALKIGKNTFNVKVTAEDKKTTKTYTLNITRKSEDEISTDATLSNLGIRPKEYDFTGFKPGNTEYTATVPNDIETVNIYANATNSKSTITGTGSKTLNIGENICEITVTAEDKKTTKTYKINITRKEKEEEKPEDTTQTTSGIKNIKVLGYTIVPEFNKDIYEYKLDISDNIEKLDIQIDTSDDYESEIAGNEKLKNGENIITILVKNKKNDEITTYQIKANIGEQNIDVSKLNNEINETQRKLNIQEWIVKGTIICIILLIIIFLVQRYRLQKEYYEYEEDYENEDEDEDEEQISETRKFYEDMKVNETYTEYTEEKEENMKKGKYKGKRFK